jgi:hypothetical protein
VECKGDGGNKAAERQIQKRVLQLLQQVGPTNYNVLILQFGLHNGSLQPAVNKLLHDKCVVLDSTKTMVYITDAGYRLLDHMKYWTEL